MLATEKTKNFLQSLKIEHVFQSTSVACFHTIDLNVKICNACFTFAFALCFCLYTSSHTNCSQANGKFQNVNSNSVINCRLVKQEVMHSCWQLIVLLLHGASLALTLFSVYFEHTSITCAIAML